MVIDRNNEHDKFMLWGSGIDYEVDFWTEWFSTSGGRWPEDFKQRLDPAREIEPSFMGLIVTADAAHARILDVGSGPISILGTNHKGTFLDITATDPLADFYAEIAEKYGVHRRVPVIKAFAEDLTSFFDSNHFDLVHCQNALDHSFEPLRAIFQMLEVVKMNGVVLLRHIPNEAENENYSGFHQWNFDVEDGCFIIWNRHERINVNRLVEGFSDIGAVKSGGVVVTIRKHAPVPDSPFVDPNARVRELLNAMMDISHQASIKK